jgi:dolichol kinase
MRLVKIRPKRSISGLIKFFSPVYVALLLLLVGYLYGLIETFTFASFLIYGIVVLATGLVLQERYPDLFTYLGRNMYHSFGGILIVVAGMFFMEFTPLLLILSCILAMFLVGWLLEHAGVETMFAKSYTLKRVKDFSKSSHYESGTYWLFSCLMLLLFFDINIAYASILILAIGDTAAGYVGRNIGRTKHWFNPKKTFEGSLGFFATATFAAMLFVPTSIALITAVLVSIVESLPLKINDNLTVPLSAGVILHLLTLI